MPVWLVNLIGTIFKVLAQVLLIPEIKAWKTRKALEKELKRIEEENRAKGEAYEAAKPDSADTEFSKLP